MKIVSNSFFYSQVKKYFDMLNRLKPAVFIFSLIVVFYLVLWTLNPNRYFILLAFIFLLLVIYKKLNNIYLSLIITYLTSTLISVGKMYPIQLIPPGVYNPDLYPNGYVVPLTVTISFIISIIMFFILIRDLLSGKISEKFLILDFLIILFFLYILISDIFVSRQALLTLAFDFLDIGGLVLYFYFRFYIKNINRFFLLLISVFSAFVIIESFISFEQFLLKSPVGKSIEAAQGIATFGKTIDEQEFIYRPGGTFNHANTLGLYLTFWLMLIFLMYIKSKQNKYIFIILLGFISLIMTLSRSAWLGYFIGMLVILFIIEKIKNIKIVKYLYKSLLYFLFIFPILLYYFVFPRVIKSIYTFKEGGGYWRNEQVRAAWEIIKNHPIFGVGTNMLVVEGLEMMPESVFGKDAVDIHNWYLSIIANHGIPAFIIFIVFVVLSVKNIIKDVLNSKRLSSNKDFLKLGYVCTIVDFFVIGLFSSGSIFYIIILSGLLNHENNR